MSDEEVTEENKVETESEVSEEDLTDAEQAEAVEDTGKNPLSPEDAEIEQPPQDPSYEPEVE